MNSRKKIQQKMIMVGSFTFISRILGILREFLLSHYLGATIAADVFFTAYKIPNSLRKIFAEGALTAAIVPTIVHTMHTKGQHAIAQLMSIAFLLFEGTLLIISGLAMYHAETIIRVIAGGFSEEKIALAIPLLQTLMPFIFFYIKQRITCWRFTIG